jgi:hypothetical protein
MFKSEKDYIPSVLQTALHKENKSALWSEIRDFVKDHLHLNEEDTEEYPSAEMERWTQILRNLTSNKTLEKLGLATYIPGGIKLTPYGVTVALRGTLSEYVQVMDDDLLE